MKGMVQWSYLLYYKFGAMTPKRRSKNKTRNIIQNKINFMLLEKLKRTFNINNRPWHHQAVT